MNPRITSSLLVLGLCAAAGAQVKVACIGNSITEGYGLKDASTQSYPARLKALLGSGYTVQNDGASGRTMLKGDAKNSYWKYGHLGQALALKPDIVVIELGTNDANNFASSWSAMGPEFKRDYLAMVDTLLAVSPKAKIFPVMPLPIRGGNDAGADTMAHIDFRAITARSVALIGERAFRTGETTAPRAGGSSPIPTFDVRGALAPYGPILFSHPR